MGSIKCPLIFQSICANCAFESLWLLIYNLEVYEFAKLQSCEIAILQFDTYKFENFNFYCAQITKLQNYLYVDFHI